mgnify:FL=1
MTAAADWLVSLDFSRIDLTPDEEEPYLCKYCEALLLAEEAVNDPMTDAAICRTCLEEVYNL